MVRTIHHSEDTSHYLAGRVLLLTERDGSKDVIAHGRGVPLRGRKETVMSWVEVKRRQVNKTLRSKIQALAFGNRNVNIHRYSHIFIVYFFALRKLRIYLSHTIFLRSICLLNFM